jgi:hypothetical protein
MVLAVTMTEPTRDEQLGAALRRIAKRMPGYTDAHFDYYIDALERDASWMESHEIPTVIRARVQVEPPNKIDGMLERVLEMVMGGANPAGVSSPISDVCEAMREHGLRDTLTPAEAIRELAVQLDQHHAMADVAMLTGRAVENLQRLEVMTRRWRATIDIVADEQIGIDAMLRAKDSEWP